MKIRHATKNDTNPIKKFNPCDYPASLFTSQAHEGMVVTNPLVKDVPKDAIIPSLSLRLLDPVGQGMCMQPIKLLLCDFDSMYVL